MLVENHMLGELHALRYRGKDPKYALVVSHGFAGHGGIYDAFCTHHAAKGVDVWSYDAPGHGKSTLSTRPRGQFTMEEWVQAGIAFATHVKQETGLPVFLLGSSFGVAAAYSGTYADAVTGTILMGSAVVPGGPFLKELREPLKSEAFQKILQIVGRGARIDVDITFDFDEDYGLDGAGEMKHSDPWNTWSYDLASWASVFSYEPTVAIKDNTKPVLIAAGEQDSAFPPDLMRATASAIGGPVELKLFKDATHQLMLYQTKKFSDAVQDFVKKYI